MSLELFQQTQNQVLWIQLELDHSEISLDQTTLSLVNPELVTIGLKVITPKEQNSSTKFSMLSEKKLKDVIVFRDSKSATLQEEVLDLEWELF